MKSVPVIEAIERFEAWLASIAELSPCWFDASRSIRSLVDVAGITIRGYGDGTSTILQIGIDAEGTQVHRLWAVQIGPGGCHLTIHASTARSHERTFLAGILSDAYSMSDVANLVDWWSTLSGDTQRVVMSPLPHDIETVANTIASLCTATVEATAMLTNSRERG
jgi:hypothetical protein